MPSLKEQILDALKGGEKDVCGLFIQAQEIDFSGIEISDVELTDTQLKKLSFSGAKFKRVVFSESRLAECDFSAAVFENCVFENCTIVNCVFDKAGFTFPHIRACRFDAVSAVASVWGSRSQLNDCVFVSCRLDRMRFESQSSIMRTVMERTCAEKAVFDAVLFQNFSLLESSFSQSGFTGCEFVLNVIDVSYLRRCVFESCAWDNPKISRSNFAGAKGLENNTGLDLAVLDSGSNTSPKHSAMSGRFAVIGFVAVVVGIVLWNLVYNPIFMLSPRLANKAVSLLDRGEYLQASKHIRVLSRRHKELPPEIVERMAATGIENLALILSRDMARSSLDSTSESLVRVMSTELDWNSGKKVQALGSCIKLLDISMVPVVRKRLLLNIAFWALEMEDLAESERAALALVDLNYDSSSVASGYLISGKIFLSRGQAGKALGVFEKSLALETDIRKRATLASRMARLYLDRGRTDRVMELVSESGLKDQARIKRIKAQVFICHGDNVSAVRELNEALGLAADSAARISILLSLAHVYIETENYADARRVMKQIVGQDMSPDTMAEVNGMNAVLQRVNGNLDAARKLYEDAVGLTANINILNWLYLDLARLYLDLSMKHQALDACQKVEDFAVAPVFTAEAKEIRASVYLKEGNIALGLALLEGALEMVKDDETSTATADNIRISLARVYRDSGNRIRLDTLCREILANNKTGDRAAETLSMMGQAAAKAGDEDTADSLFRQAFTIAQDEGLRVWSGLELARLMHENGRREDAVGMVKKIITESTDEDNRFRAKRMLEGFSQTN